MTALADWYPGDSGTVAALEVLGLITTLTALAWIAERLLGARRCPALRAALWLAVLVATLLTPVVVVIGRQLPWHVAVLPAAGTAPTRHAERSSGEGPHRSATLAAPRAETGEATQSYETAGRHEETPTLVASGPVHPKVKAAGSSLARPQPARDPEEVPATPAEPAATDSSRLHAFVTLGLLIWGLGSLYLAVRLLHGGYQIRRLCRRLHPLDRERWAAELTAAARTLSVARLPDINPSLDAHAPFVAGLFRPRVVLPDALCRQSTSEQLVAIITHECAHILRRDPWMRLLQRLATMLYWVHPLIHLLNRRLDQAREEVCDNHVLAFLDAPTYAEALLRIAQLCYPVSRLGGHLAMMPRHYTLEHRVANLLEERRDPATRLPDLQRLALLAILALLLGAASSIGLRGTVRAEDDKTLAAAPAPYKDQTPPAAVGKVAGRVLAADGAPAAGAVVWAAQFDFGPLSRRETRADAKGFYELELPPGTWQLRTRRGTAGGEATTPRQNFQITAGRKIGPVAIHLEERGTFRGRLLEAESGKPIPGGQLFLDNALVLTADAAGRFKTGGLTRTHHEAFVVAPGRMRLRILFDTTARSDTELDVPVPRGGKIVGRVTDTDGKPIPGAYVGRHTSGSYFSINGLFLACDASGRFEYDDAATPGHPTRLTAAAPGFIESERDGLRAPADKPLVLHFRLRPKPGTPASDREPDAEKRRTVSGVVRSPDGKPAAGVVVRWGYEPHVGATQRETDAEGRFRLVVPDRDGMLAVLPRAFLPQFPQVAEGGDRTVEIALQAGGTARGRVVDDTGKPIGGVRVVAVVPSPDPRIGNQFWLSEAAVRTDAEGKFEVKGVPDNARFDFLKSGLSDVRNHPLDLSQSEFTVAMQYGGALQGRVVDRDGKPICNFRVLVGFPRQRRPGDVTSGYFAGYSGIGVRFTSADGSFVLTGVGAGSVYRLAAIADGHGEAVADRVTAVPVNRLKDVRPTVLRAGPPVRLRLRALTTDGKPVSGALVTLVNGQPEHDRSFLWGYHDASWEDMVRGRTGADGWADFPALSFGSATVLVQASGFARHRAGWRNGEKELTCKLDREAVLTGEVLDAGGKAVKKCYINLLSQGDQISAAVEREDKGRFRITELPSGTWKVTIRGADGRDVLHEAELKLPAGQTKELQIQTKAK